MSADTINLLSRQAAAEWLEERLPGKTAKQWYLWLSNNAAPSRVAATGFRIAFQRSGKGGKAFYNSSDLREFAEFEEARGFGKIALSERAAAVIRATGMGTPQGSRYGRKWEGATVAIGTNNDAPSENKLFIQVVIGNPYLVYAMTPDEAGKFGKDLLDFANHAESIKARSAKQDTISAAVTVDQLM